VTIRFCLILGLLLVQAAVVRAEEKKITPLPPLSGGYSHEERQMELVMGTLLEISVDAETKEEAREAVQEGFKEARRWENILSNYKSGSEISRLNREAYPESVEASKEMIHFLQTAQDLCAETSGYFDIMMEPLTRLWALRERILVKMPLQKDIDKARFKVDYRYLEIYESDNTVRFLVEDAGMDVGGIGKGYALDRTLKKVRTRKIRSAVFNFGGEILYWSLKGAEEGRKISVKNPLQPDRIWKIFSIAEFPGGGDAAGVSTSANYERYVTVESGKKLSHILNPKTGWPVENEIRSVTVISASGARADALSTGLFAMGLEKVKEFSASHPQDWVLILYQEGSGPLKSFSSGKLK